MDETSACRVGFGRAVINPEPGVSLVGYFNPRPNTGVLDDLQVKTMLIEANGTLTGLISYDLCILSGALIKSVRTALRGEGHPFADTIPLVATHTHTGPDVGGIISESHASEEYIHAVAQWTVNAAKAALSDLAPAEIRAGGVMDNPFAFNRRYWMKNGAVVTNPGKHNPDIVKPEGPVDREIGLLAVRRQAQIVGIVANISNHTDTIGGDKVSADWPGRMEKAIQEHVGAAIPVITLIVPSGNINHFDVDWDDPQVSYAEAQRIGRGYAQIVCRELDRLEPIRPAPLSIETLTVTIGRRRISSEQIEEARRIVAEEVEAGDRDLTSEDLARGSPVVRKFFAEQLLEYVKTADDRGRDFDIAALKFSDDLAVVFLPGEPFTQIGLKLKEVSPFKRTFVAELTNGECGYVPMKECFGRGGYETLPVVGGGPREDTCDLLIEKASQLLRK